MAIRLVTYDLMKSGQNYDAVLKYIKSHNWARVSESSYVIETNDSPATIRDSLRQVMDSNDNVYVFTLDRMYAGYGPQEVNEWLEQKLT